MFCVLLFYSICVFLWQEFRTLFRIHYFPDHWIDYGSSILPYVKPKHKKYIIHTWIYTWVCTVDYKITIIQLNTYLRSVDIPLSPKFHANTERLYILYIQVQNNIVKILNLNIWILYNIVLLYYNVLQTVLFLIILPWINSEFPLLVSTKQQKVPKCILVAFVPVTRNCAQQ